MTITKEARLRRETDQSSQGTRVRTVDREGEKKQAARQGDQGNGSQGILYRAAGAGTSLRPNPSQKQLPATEEHVGRHRQATQGWS